MGQAINTNATSEETTSKQSNEDKAPLLLTCLLALAHKTALILLYHPLSFQASEE